LDDGSSPSTERFLRVNYACPDAESILSIRWLKVTLSERRGVVTTTGLVDSIMVPVASTEIPNRADSSMMRFRD